LELQARTGFYTHLDGPYRRIPVGKLKVGLIAQVRKPHWTNNLTSDPLLSDPESAHHHGMVACAGHPLIVEDRLLGVMSMFAARPFSTVVVDSLSTVADAIALGIQRQRAKDALHQAKETAEAANLRKWAVAAI
jgi:GAF domain-containing protein